MADISGLRNEMPTTLETLSMNLCVRWPRATSFFPTAICEYEDLVLLRRTHLSAPSLRSLAQSDQIGIELADVWIFIMSILVCT